MKYNFIEKVALSILSKKIQKLEVQTIAPDLQLANARDAERVRGDIISLLSNKIRRLIDECSLIEMRSERMHESLSTKFTAKIKILK